MSTVSCPCKGELFIYIKCADLRSMICYTLSRNHCPVEVCIRNTVVHAQAAGNLHELNSMDVDSQGADMGACDGAGSSVENSLSMHIKSIVEVIQQTKLYPDKMAAGVNGSGSGTGTINNDNGAMCAPQEVRTGLEINRRASIGFGIHPQAVTLSSNHTYASFSRNKPRNGPRYCSNVYSISKSGFDGKDLITSTSAGNGGFGGENAVNNGIDLMRLCFSKQWITNPDEDILHIDVVFEPSASFVVSTSDGTNWSEHPNLDSPAGCFQWNITHRTKNPNHAFQTSSMFYGEHGRINNMKLHGLPVDSRTNRNGMWSAVETNIVFPCVVPLYNCNWNETNTTRAEFGSGGHETTVDRWAKAATYCVITHLISQKKDSSIMITARHLNHPLLMELVYILSSIYERVHIVKLQSDTHKYGGHDYIGRVPAASASSGLDMSEYCQCYIICSQLMNDTHSRSIIQQLQLWNTKQTLHYFKLTDLNHSYHAALPHSIYCNLQRLILKPPSLYFLNKWEELNAMVGQQHLEYLVQYLNQTRGK